MRGIYISCYIIIYDDHHMMGGGIPPLWVAVRPDGGRQAFIVVANHPIPV